MSDYDSEYLFILKPKQSPEIPLLVPDKNTGGRRFRFEAQPMGSAPFHNADKQQPSELKQSKVSVRAKVEHCFHVLKCLFKHRKTRYRGLAKNNAQLFTLFALSNLVLARRFLGTQHTQVAP